MSIRENIEYIRRLKDEAAVRSGRKGDDVLLIAVTKLHSADEINEAIDAGITDIGENKVQEILDKYDSVKPVKWHLIGHLQTNKVKYIIDKVDLIHSLDSMKLAQEIEKRAAKIDRIMDVLVQVNSAEEESKFGVGVDETEDLIKSIRAECTHINIKGLMCIAPLEDDPEDARPFFRAVKEIFDRHEDFTVLSMGMSNDFQVAIEEGSTAIRVGTAIFGNRDYRSEEK
ncbi:MAG: YggS family pyridoxal phosphate-dependent enzyme [Firmicutes bacterium]|nr:YggS family pyridoxal phosphate-dependent enzyme [Bacillota bacterium]